MALINTTTTGVLGSTFFGDGTGDLTIQQNGVTINKITAAPTFSAYQSSGGQSISNSTVTKVTFDVKEWDTANCFDNTTNYRFTPNVAGYYQVNSQLSLNTLSPTEAQFLIYKNGIQYRRGMRLEGTSIEPYLVNSSLVFLNGTTDYIEMYVFQTSGGTSTTENQSPNGFRGTYFQAILVRAA
jgi:hypothetical protein